MACNAFTAVIENLNIKAHNTIKLLSELIVSQASCLVAFKKRQKQYTPSKMLRVPWARCSEYYDTIINCRLYNSCRRQGKRTERGKLTSFNIRGLNEFF